MSERVIIMLGMHRSGTSVLAGTLEEAGVYLGHVVRDSPDNPKGWCENPLVYMMHENVLIRNGGSTVRPPHTCAWSYEHKLMRDTIIDSFRGHPIWGFKDPRTIFTLEGWLEALPHSEIVGIFRHPWLVYESLKRRDSHTAFLAGPMWMKYNRRLLEWHRQIGFPMISFDDLDCTFEEQVKQLANRLKLPGSLDKLDYYEAKYRRTAITDRELSPEVLDVYSQLQAARQRTWSNTAND